MDVLMSAITIAKTMQDDVGQSVLHRSRWRCLASTYFAEIQDLIDLVKLHFKDYEQFMWAKLLLEPLQVLGEAVQEGEACMRAYIPSEGNYHSWLLEALKLSMSTDVLDLHLPKFLWASSVVRLQIFRITEIRSKEAYLLERRKKLREIWVKQDADEDLRTAESFLRMLQGEYRELVDFILCKLSHVNEEARHNHRTPGALHCYMCIHSDQCLPTDRIHFKTDCIEIKEVVWLGAHFVLKSFKYLDEYDHLFNEEAAINDSINTREATIQARVWHPHLVPLICCTKDPPGLLMERLQENLHDLIKCRRQIHANDSPFPLIMAVDLMLQIAEGMEYLHSDGIIHRDLKSTNILVNYPVVGDSNSKVHLKITDFGVSKTKDDCSMYTTRDQGTVAWMAPEVYGQADGSECPKYSNKADVYSFGIVWYEILTGKVPFKGLRNSIVRDKVLQGDRPTLPQNCPPALSSFIQMCWHADPSKRPTFIQICRMLRYFKACLLLADCHDEEARLLRRRIPPHMCAHIDDMIAHSLLGEKVQPKALDIPLEMYLCGVQLQKFGFPCIPQVQSSAGTWDSWTDKVYVVMRHCTTRQQRMCESSAGRWRKLLAGGSGRGRPPHFKALRRFTFTEYALQPLTCPDSDVMLEQLGGASVGATRGYGISDWFGHGNANTWHYRGSQRFYCVDKAHVY